MLRRITPNMWGKLIHLLYNVNIRGQDADQQKENTSNNIQTSMTSNEATYHRERLGQWASGEDQHIPGKVSGIARMKEASLNKGLCFTIEERQSLGIHGLLPPKVRTEEEQIAHCHHYIDRYDKDINKYLYLMGLLERNEKLFFKVLASDVQKFMPLVYTPTVGLACQQYSNLYTLPRGLFITIYDKGHIYEVLKNWPERDVRAVVVTDGERILGLGDLGINGMGIPVGKLCLYTALAGIKPHQCLPVTLDVGTNTQSILNDPFYMGLRQKRVTGNEYDEFVDEFMKAVVRRFGRNCLIQFEDFGNVNAFRLIEKYKKLYCTFNDDIQGTAAVAVAGIIASLRATKTRLKDNVLVFQGAGEANLGIANLCVMAMVAEGLNEAEARSKIWMVDSKGLIVKNRPEGGISSHKAVFAQNHEPIPTLLEVIKQAKPTILIGAAAIGGAFTREVLEVMGKNNAKPVIFALSNPTHKAECTAEEAYKYTDGKAIFASGSPFAPVTYKDKTYYPGQGNNSYIFPGVALAAICAGMKIIDDDAFLIAARSLARQVTQEDLDKGSLYPPLSTIQECSVKIARDIVEYAYNEGYATVIPEPKDKEAFIRAQMFNPYYGSAIPTIFPYPKV